MKYKRRSESRKHNNLIFRKTINEVSLIINKWYDWLLQISINNEHQVKAAISIMTVAIQRNGRYMKIGAHQAT